ncbi:hypothetical protein V1521DRAFT_483541 [Lipomyces starkeyi]
MVRTPNLLLSQACLRALYPHRKQWPRYALSNLSFIAVNECSVNMTIAGSDKCIFYDICDSAVPDANCKSGNYDAVVEVESRHYKLGWLLENGISKLKHWPGRFMLNASPHEVTLRVPALGLSLSLLPLLHLIHELTAMSATGPFHREIYIRGARVVISRIYPHTTAEDVLRKVNSIREQFAHEEALRELSTRDSIPIGPT